jgi:predicted phage tail protein
MELSLTTPAMLFPAISLLLLAYTNRFLTLAGVIRTLHNSCESSPHSRESVKIQIDNLRKRVHIIKYMQGLGAASFFSCVLTMLLIFMHFSVAATTLFGVSLVLLLGSLLLSLWEIKISVDALEAHLADMSK